MSYQIPQFCPCCTTPLVRDGVHYFCPNETGCSDQVSQRIKHAVGKGALDWDGFGPAQVTAMLSLGCEVFSDLFSVTEAAVSTVLGPVQTAKFVAERERVKSAPLWRKLAALGIELVGQTACKKLCDEWHSLVDMVAAGPGVLIELLGPVATKNFVAYLGSHASELERCEEYGYMYSEQAAVKSAGPLSGKTFCITGAMTTGTRPQVGATIEKYGGQMKGSVGKGLDYLVVGESGGAGKANAAKKYGTTCITEDQLYGLIGIQMPTMSGTDAADWD